MKLVSLFLSALLGLLSYVNGKNITMEWTPEAVASINFTLSVEIGDRVTLLCLKNSYSNLVYLDNEEHWDTCDSSIGTGKRFLRGSCIGVISTELIITILEPSATLGSDPLFVAGEKIYFTSFSTGASLSSSYNDIISGGECLTDNLKLAFDVQEKVVPTTPMMSSTEDVTDDVTVNEGSLSTNTASDSILTPQGLLNSVNGCSLQYVAPTYSILTCTLIAVLLRLYS